jgi:hypothetical protein
LDRAGKLLQLHALFLRGDDVKRQHGQHRAVHGHRNRNAIQRNGVEQNLHVLDRIDGHARFAHVGKSARMIGVVTAMGRQIEGDGQALLAGGDVAAIKGVALLGGGKAGVLADRPRLGDIHRAVRPAHKRRKPGMVSRCSQPARSAAV